MGVNPFTAIYNNWYKKLKSNEKRMFFLFVFILSGALYFTGVLKPALDKVTSLMKQERDNQTQLAKYKSQYPDAVKAEQEIKALKQNLGALANRMSSVESKLISAEQEQELLSEFIRRAQEAGVDLESVKEDIKEEKEEFVRLNIILKFSSDYKKTINYLRKLETISTFVKIENMELGQSKKEPASTIDSSISLSVILSNSSGSRAQLSMPEKKDTFALDKIQRSPFTPKFVTEKAKKKNLKVTGITYRADESKSTAIINDKIVNIGSEVEGEKVVRILPNSVVLDDGMEKETVQLER